MGDCVQFRIFILVRSHRTTVDSQSHRTLYGPDPPAQVFDLDKHDYGPPDCRASSKMCLAPANAKDREVCGPRLLQSWSGLCCHQHCALHLDVHDRYVLYPDDHGLCAYQEPDLLGNLTGTSLTTFMLCTIELMLAGLCINIPMLRPFYLQWRAKYKNSSFSNSGRMSGNKLSVSGQLGSGHVQQPRPGQYTQWIELVSQRDQCYLYLTRLIDAE